MTTTKRFPAVCPFCGSKYVTNKKTQRTKNKFHIWRYYFCNECRNNFYIGQFLLNGPVDPSSQIFVYPSSPPLAKYFYRLAVLFSPAEVQAGMYAPSKIMGQLRQDKYGKSNLARHFVKDAYLEWVRCNPDFNIPDADKPERFAQTYNLYIRQLELEERRFDEIGS